MITFDSKKSRRTGVFRWQTQLFLVVFGFAAGVAHAQAPPFNDDFANAEVLAADGTWQGTNVDATTEPGEPTHYSPGGTSVWFQWTAPTDGFLTVDTVGSLFDTMLAMYTGSQIDMLSSIASDDDSFGAQSQLPDVPVVAGTVYHIAVDGYLGSFGNLSLNWSLFNGPDVTPPEVSIAKPIEADVYVQNAIVLSSYMCTDEPIGSGVASCIGDVPVGDPINTTTLGPQTFTVTAIDVAGNVSVAEADYVVSGSDVTPPTISISEPLDGIQVAAGAALVANYTCADELEGTGLSSCNGDVVVGAMLDTSQLGAFTFTVVATDNAGNQNTSDSSYSVFPSPENDNFSGALSLQESGNLVGTNVAATKEAGEPNHAGNSGGSSVWYEWTALTDGYLTIDTFGSTFDTTLALYEGMTLNELTVLASNNNTSGLQSKLENVPVTAGVSYHFAVDGYNNAVGDIALTWSWQEQFDTVPPVISFLSPSQGAIYAQNQSVFAQYTCFDPFPGAGLETCIGNSPNGQLLDTSVAGDFVFTVTATDFAGNATSIERDYRVNANPMNDDFDNAEVLDSEGTLTGTNAGATLETGEPGNSSAMSVWFSWTATSDGFITFDTLGSSFDTVLGMYTGISVDALTELALNDDTVGFTSELKDIPVAQGTTYSIALSSDLFASFGEYVLNWSFVTLTDQIAPTIEIIDPKDGAILFEGVTVAADYTCVDENLGSGVLSCVGNVAFGESIDTTIVGSQLFSVTATDNSGNTRTEIANYSVVTFAIDNFASAYALANRGTLVATSANATLEPGEPDHGGSTGGASVWFAWTAAETGFLSVDTIFTQFNSKLAIYTGVSVDALTELGSDDGSSSVFAEVADLAVSAGETYYIAVDGVDGLSGQIQLNWNFFNGPTFTEITPVSDPLWVTDAAHDFWLNAAASADIDGDGDLDIAVVGFFVEYNVSATDRFVVFINDGVDANGEMVFSTQEVPLNDLTTGASDLAWGDFDNDGDPDLAVGSNGATEIYRNDSGVLVNIETTLPGYSEDSSYTGAYNLRSLSWADFDNDGDLDLLIPSVYDSANSTVGTALMRNDGADGVDGWSFSEVPALLDSTVHAQTAWADNDGDGDLDLFLANVENGTGNGFVRTYRNDGGGVFASAQPVGTLSLEHGASDWLDYDSDGDLDVLVVGRVHDADGTYRTVLRIYTNESGVFHVNTLITSGFFPWLDLHAATWADYNSDGDIDILVTGSFFDNGQIAGKSEIYVNEGDSYRPLGRDLPAPVGASGRGGTFTWLDIDGDADLDYFVAGAYYVANGSGLLEARMHLYRNDATDTNQLPNRPLSPDTNITDTSVEFSWNTATDDGTADSAITYDFELRRQEVGATSDLARQPLPGNIGTTTSWAINNLAPGSYSWSVRAVDSAFNGSEKAQGAFTIGLAGDADSDGVLDNADNCIMHSNSDQRDTDDDGYGNRCDPDFDDNGIVNFIDVSIFGARFLGDDPDADLNGDGIVNFLDFSILSEFFLSAPGPSALGK